MKSAWPFKILLLFCLLVPLAFSAQTFDHYNTPKLAIFLLLTFVLLLFIIPRFRNLLKIPPLVRIAACLFLAVQCFQAFRITNLGTGLFGEYGQSEALLIQLGFLILLAAGYLFINPDSELEQLGDVIVIVTFLLSIYGIGQYFGFDPVTRKDSIRVCSLMGDPNSLAFLLNLSLPMLYWRMEQETTRLPRWLLAVGIVAAVTALILTFSRTGWLGFLIGFACFIILMARPFRGKRHLAVSTVIIILLGVITGIFIKWWFGIVLVYLLLLGKWIWDSVERRRFLAALTVLVFLGAVLGGVLSFVEIRGGHAGRKPDYNLELRLNSLRAGNDSGRSLLWGTAGTIFRHAPVIGHGMGTFSVWFHRYESRAAVFFWEPERDLRQAHNEWLHYLATQGLLGLISFVALLAAILVAVWPRRLLRSAPLPVHASLYSGIIAYLLCMQFAYPLLHYSFLFWIYLGVLLRFHYPLAEQTFTTEPGSKQRFGLGIGLALLLIWTVVVVRGFAADVLYNDAFFQARYLHFEQSLANYRRAIRNAPWAYHYQYRYVVTLLRAYHYNPTKTEYLELAQKTLHRLAETDPLRYQVHELTADCAVARHDLQTAAHEYRRAIELFPMNYRLYWDLARTELARGDRGAARIAYKQGEKIYPSWMRYQATQEKLSLFP